MSTANATNQQGDEWMSVPQTEEALGISRSKVFSAVVAGTLVAQQVAGRTVIRRDTVIAELERRKQNAAETEVSAAQ